MKYRQFALALCAVLFFAVALVAQSNGSSTETAENEENSVYKAVIKQMFAGDKVTFDTQEKVTRLVIRDSTLKYEGFGKRENWTDVQNRLKPLQDETFSDYEARNKDGDEISKSLDLPIKYTFINKGEIDAIFKSNSDGWKRFYEKYPDSGGFIGFSHVGFNKSKTQALVYFDHSCGNLCASGHYILLNKTADGWSVVENTMLWIS